MATMPTTTTDVYILTGESFTIQGIKPGTNTMVVLTCIANLSTIKGITSQTTVAINTRFVTKKASAKDIK